MNKLNKKEIELIKAINEIKIHCKKTNNCQFCFLCNKKSNVCFSLKEYNHTPTFPRSWQIPKIPLVTENQQTFLSCIDKKYKWIARDDDGSVFVFKEKPEKNDNEWWSPIYRLEEDCMNVSTIIEFPFTFIPTETDEDFFNYLSWEDEEPKLISYLLDSCKGEEE